MIVVSKPVVPPSHLHSKLSTGQNAKDSNSAGFGGAQNCPPDSEEISKGDVSRLPNHLFFWASHPFVKKIKFWGSSLRIQEI